MLVWAIILAPRVVALLNGRKKPQAISRRPISCLPFDFYRQMRLVHLTKRAPMLLLTKLSTMPGVAFSSAHVAHAGKHV